MHSRREPKTPSCLHDFLLRHKVILDVFAAVCLGLASVIVAILQWRTASKQNELLSLQNEIARRQIRPNFVLSIHQLKPAGETMFANAELWIQNFGGAARNPRDQVAVWLNISAMTTNNQVLETNIPVNGYYFMEGVTSDSVNGLLFRHSGDHNNEGYGNLFHSLLSIPKNYPEIRSCSVELREYVRINYDDLFDQHHVDDFYVEEIHGGSRISSSEASKWLDEFGQKFWARGGIEWYKATPVAILEIVSRQLGR